ncbi:hypothetical protein [Aureimonas sp. AU12]|uniref:hypothetical protein n=1 Tax=Aureimonas sp. AU12 TaxID=1638161 RepID=UPI00078043E5|nr:hypothetical protein [Aureimonas sp. AU12]
MASTPVAFLRAGVRAINDLINPAGHRLYLTASERAAFLAAAAKGDREVRTYCEVLHIAGCRISEALALTVRRVDLDARFLVFETDDGLEAVDQASRSGQDWNTFLDRGSFIKPGNPMYPPRP